MTPLEWTLSYLLVGSVTVLLVPEDLCENRFTKVFVAVVWPVIAARYLLGRLIDPL